MSTTPHTISLTFYIALIADEEQVQAMTDALQNYVRQFLEHEIDNVIPVDQVEDFHIDTQVLAGAPPVQEDLAAFFLSQIEDAQISPADVADDLARYGLMNPVTFANEIGKLIDEHREDDRASDAARDRG